MQCIIFVFIIIISRNIQIGIQIFSGILIHLHIGGRIRHILFVFRNIGRRTHENLHVMLPILLPVFRALRHPLILVHRQIRDPVQVLPKPVHAGTESSGSGGVDAVDHIHNLLSHPDTFYASRLRNLVSNGIDHHAGMIIRILHHSRRILTKAVREPAAIGVSSLRTVPKVKGFIHHIKPHLVAGLHQAPGHGMMGGAKSVETTLLFLPPHPHKIPGQETLHSRPPQHGTYP